MARVNVYLPDDLAADVKEAELNVSAITQEALRQSLLAQQMNRWLDEAKQQERHYPNVSRQDVVKAVREAREEFGR